MLDTDLDSYRADCLSLEPEALEEELVRLPADYGYWAERFASAKVGHLRAKAERDRVRAQLYSEWQLSLKADGGRVTEANISASVDQDPRWLEAQATEITALGEVHRLQGTLEGLRCKREALQQIAYMRREELRSSGM